MTEWLYLYCFFDATEYPFRHGEPALPPEIFPVTHNNLGAFVCLVDEAEYSSETLRRKLQNAELLEAEVKKHQFVLEKISAICPVVPARFCTVVTERNLIALINDNSHQLRKFLEFIKDKEEWGIKVYADMGIIENYILDNDQNLKSLSNRALVSTTGEAYLLNKKIKALLEENIERALCRLKQQIFNRLKEAAVEAKNNSTEPHGGGNHKGKTILNAAYLLLKADAQQFKELVNEEASLQAQWGLSFRINGPWPPYNFCPPIEVMVTD